MATETLYVSSYSEVNREWDEVGASPWLNDSDANSISTSVDEELHDEFGYADSVQTGNTLVSVVAYFEVNGPSARNDQLVPYIHDGASWQALAGIDPDGDGYVWYNEDISSILDTWAKVQSALLRCRYNKSGSPQTQTIYVRRAYLLITYSVGVIAKGFADVGGGVEAFTTPLHMMGFGDIGGGVDAFVNPFRAMGFPDVGGGVDTFITPFRSMGFSDVGSGGVGAFILLQEKAFGDVGGGVDVFASEVTSLHKYFPDTGSGIDAFITPYRAMGFSDVGGGVDVFTNPYRAMGFADVGSGVDVFTLLRELGFSDVGSGIDVFDVLLQLIFTDIGGGVDAFEAEVPGEEEPTAEDRAPNPPSSPSATVTIG